MPVLAPLLVRTNAEPFGERELPLLEERLRRQGDDTDLGVLDVPEQLLLGPDGRTRRGGLQYTTRAFAHACSLLAGGLAELAGDLSGERPRMAVPPALCSIDDAIAVFNLAVARRFALAEGMQIICDARQRLFEGLVGASYRRVTNAEFLEQVESATSSFAAGTEFRGAALVGRALSLRYRAVTPCFEAAPGDAFHRAYLFGNTETGDGSARAYSGLWRAADGGWSFGDFREGGRLRHQGKAFRRLLGRALAAVETRATSTDELSRRAGVLRLLPLARPGRARSDHGRMRALVGALSARGLSRLSGQAAVLDVMGRSAASTDAMAIPGLGARTALSERTAYDLFVALARRAAEQHAPSRREKQEQLAYSLLVGRVRLPLPAPTHSAEDES